MTRPLATPTPVAGQAITRVDGRLKVTGQARYAADNPVPDHLNAVLVCSTVSRATIDAIDTETAAEHHDVVRVITDFRGVTLPYDISRVSFFGQPLAIVIANTLQAATHGAALVAVRYRADRSTPTSMTPPPHVTPASRVPTTLVADAVLRTAPVVVDRT